MQDPSAWLQIWGPPILQVFVVLLVFAWGLPALLLQTVQPPALQRLLRNTFHFTRSSILLLLLLLLGADLVLALALGWRPPLLPPAKVPNAVALLTIFGTSFLGLAILFYFQAFRLDQVTEKVGARAEKYARRLRSGSQKPKDTRKLGKALDSLGALGEMARGQSAKSDILDAIAKIDPIVSELVFANHSEAGSFVDQYTRAIRRTVSSVDAPARAGNFKFALTHLRSIFERLASDHPDHADPVGRVLERIGRQVTARTLAEPAADLAPALQTAVTALRDRPTFLFWVGARCVEDFAAEGSIPAFRHLVSGYLWHENGSAGPHSQQAALETEAMLLGLAAILRGHGPNLCRWAEQGLDTALPADADLPARLQRAAEYFMRLADFSVADTLDAWRQELLAPATSTERAAPAGDDDATEPGRPETTIYNRPWVQFQTFRGPVGIVDSK